VTLSQKDKKQTNNNKDQCVLGDPLINEPMSESTKPEDQAFTGQHHQ
jgi:hypothetical protein